MWPDRVSNPVSLTYESGALPTALRSPARCIHVHLFELKKKYARILATFFLTIMHEYANSAIHCEIGDKAFRRITPTRIYAIK